MKNESKVGEYVAGFALLFAVLALGWHTWYLKPTQAGEPVKAMLLFRMIAGLGLGYALGRSFFGFAGSVNRSYRAGSTKLMQTLMVMFVATAAINAAFLWGNDPTSYKLWIKPINLGLIIGGSLFGFGMAFSSCCATGVLTDVVMGLPRALITLAFFGVGVFVGFPVQKVSTWVSHSWFTTPTFAKDGKGGVFLPDWFKWDGSGGYIGALIFLAVLGGIAIWLSRLYEQSRKDSGTYSPVDTEEEQIAAQSDSEYEGIYQHLFAKPWTLGMGAAMIVVIFALLMGVTKSGWGASTPYGYWFGRILRLFGVSAESLAAFSKQPVANYTAPFFENAMNVQNICIILGTVIALLMMGRLVSSVKEGMPISGKGALLYAVGGFSMGFGTTLSNGCNVGAMYTPIANFSLSGWIFLTFMVAGGILGNRIFKKVMG